MEIEISKKRNLYILFTISLFLILNNFTQSSIADSNDGKILVFEYYYFYYPYIYLDPNTLNPEMLEQQYKIKKVEKDLFSFTLSKEHYKEDYSRREVFIHYQDYRSVLKVYSVFSLDNKEKLNAEIVQNELFGNGKNARNEALGQFETMLIAQGGYEGYTSFSPNAVPIVNCIFKNIDFSVDNRLNNNAVIENSYEAYNDSGQLIVGKKFEKEKNKEILYVIDFFPNRATTGYSDYNLLWEFSQNLILDWGINPHRIHYWFRSKYDIGSDLYNYKKIYYNTIKDDPYATYTILPLLILRNKIDREILDINEIYYDYFRDFKNLEPERDKKINEIFEEERFNVETTNISNLLHIFCKEQYEILQERMNERSESLNLLKKEIEDLYSASTSINGIIFLAGGIFSAGYILRFILHSFFPSQISQIWCSITRNKYLGLLIVGLSIFVFLYDISFFLINYDFWKYLYSILHFCLTIYFMMTILYFTYVTLRFIICYLKSFG